MMSFIVLSRLDVLREVRRALSGVSGYTSTGIYLESLWRYLDVLNGRDILVFGLLI